MKSSINPSQIPTNLQDLPWLKAIVSLCEQQAKQIQEQAKQIQAQAERIATLEKTVQELKDENARLRKLPKRPKFRPGGGNPKDRSGKPKGGGGRGPTLSKGVVPEKAKEEISIPAVEVPEGSRFKGYQTYVVQEIELTPKEVTYKLEVWQAPDGRVIRGQLPPEVQGSHFGHHLRALCHNFYALGMTEPGLFQFLVGCGIEVSEGQIHNILMGESKGYEEEGEKVLKAGLEEAPYISADDTGARHQHKNGYCTHIGGEHFAYYRTTASKSRANFLKILLQGKEGYWINEAFIWHLFQSGVEDDLLNHFEEYVGKRYRARQGLSRLLNQLGIGNKKLRQCCFEAGLVGFTSETLLKPGQVLLTDRAGQFSIFDHAGCWVHMERPLRKLKVHSPQAEEELREVREAIWHLYGKLKEAALTQTNREEVEKLYDQLIAMKSISPSINAVITSFAKCRDEMLKALDHPGLPLHNNASEQDIRSMVRRRKISGGTKSDEGRAFRDGLMTLRQTCLRLDLSFWEYLMRWFKREPLDLAQIVRDRYRANAAIVAPG